MAEEIKTNTQALERLKEIEKGINICIRKLKFYDKYKTFDILDYESKLRNLKQEANKIREEFKDGCGELFAVEIKFVDGEEDIVKSKCGYEDIFCPTCHEIKEILARINK